MLKSAPFIILIWLPLGIIVLIASYQIAYWHGAKVVTIPLESERVTKAREFNALDERRATTREIVATLIDDKGNKYTFRQLSPLTKYFYEYGDPLTVKYFNEKEFEGTIFNFTIKFYYVLIVLAYIAVSLLFIGFAEKRTRKKTTKRLP